MVPKSPTVECYGLDTDCPGSLGYNAPDNLSGRNVSTKPNLFAEGAFQCRCACKDTASVGRNDLRVNVSGCAMHTKTSPTNGANMMSRPLYTPQS